MVRIRFVFIGATQRISLSVLTQNPHKGPEVEERRKVPGKDRDSQLTKEGRREQSAWDSSPEKDTVSRSEKMEVGQSRDESAFLVVLWKFRVKYTSTIACKCTESCTKVSKTPSSCTWSWPKSVFVRLFLSSTLSVVFCVSVMKCVMPLVGTTRCITGHE